MSALLEVIDKAAKTAANGVIIRTLDPAERYEIAWGACAVAAVEHVRETGVMPYPSAIVKAGLDAVGRDQWQWSHDRGIGAARGHRVYWRHVDTPAPADVVVDPIAVGQVMSALDDGDRDVIEQVAAAASIKEAASLRGESYATTASKYRTARQRFYALWFEGQSTPVVPQPRRRYQRKTECLNGHARTPDNLYGNGTCRACALARRAAA